MRILSNFALKYTTIINSRNCDIPKYGNNVNNVMQCDSVSFGRSAGNAESLRKLMAYKIPDMYSGKIVIDPKILENFFESKVFSGTVKSIVKTIAPYESSLHSIEKEVFTMIKEKAKQSPNKNLNEVMKELAVIHDTRLRKLQQPIFSRLEILAQEMPLEERKKFASLMNLVNKKLVKEPIKVPFSAKEFKYKLQRIADEIATKNDKSEIDTIKKIMRIVQQMPEYSIEESTEAQASPLSKAKKQKKARNKKSLVRKRSEILKRIESMQMASPLKTNKELENLIVQTRAKIYNIPIVANFNRKSFIYELQKITQNLTDKKLANTMSKIAAELPKSRQNVSAFIVKAANSSSEKIGYDLLEGSTGSIEHLIPFAQNGKDSLENYGISTAYYNSERGNRSMEQQLLRHPETYKNCQKQVDKLIVLANNGTFKKVGLTKWYIINFAKRILRLSPPEKPLILDLSKLKQK